MPDIEMAPVKVERELGSDGEPTGKYVFHVGHLHRFYWEEYDTARMERAMEDSGYDYREFRPMIHEIESQYEALQSEKPAKVPAKKPAAPDEEPEA